MRMFHSPDHGIAGKYPFSRADARIHHKSQYHELDTVCAVCHTPNPARYTDTMECVTCCKHRYNGQNCPNGAHRRDGLDCGTCRTNKSVRKLARGKAYKKVEGCLFHGDDAPHDWSTGSCLVCQRSPAFAPSIARVDAKKLGFMFYQSSKPCLAGHTAPRFTSTGNCKQCTFERSAVSKVKAPIMERFEARQNGLKYYRSGEPCHFGHTCARSTRTGKCVQCHG